MSKRRRKWWQRTIRSAELLESRVVLDGHGVFTTPIDVEIPGRDGAGVQLGDMNNDGYLDAVVIGDGRSSRVFENDGHGNFQPVGTAFGPQSPRGCGLADLDADGDLDIVIGDTVTGARIWWNRGSYQFVPSTTAFTPGQGTVELAVADVNGDSSPDLLISDGQLFIFRNDGQGFFLQYNEVLSGGAMIVADVDGDHDVDVLTGSFLGIGGLLALNDGQGNFAPAVSIVATIDGAASSVADFNGDGNLDIYVSNHSHFRQDGHIFYLFEQWRKSIR